MERTHRTAALAVSLMVLGGSAGFAAGAKQETQQTEAVERQAGKKAQHNVIRSDELTWTDGPAALPPGARVAKLEGDPMMKGVFTLRLEMPAGYQVAPHTHPRTEHITVVSGTLNVAMGEKMDKSRGRALSAGGFAAMHPGMAHYVWTTEKTVLQLHGIGPWEINYVNPSDDPRQRVRGEDELEEEMPEEELPEEP